MTVRRRFKVRRIITTQAEVVLPVVTIAATDSTASETGQATGLFTFTRTGATTASLFVNYSIGAGAGAATNGVDYNVGDALTGEIEIIPGSSTATILITPADDVTFEGTETVTLTVQIGSYTIGTPSSAVVTIADDDEPEVSGEHPRIYAAGQAGLTALRNELAGDAAFRSRWNAAIAEHELSSSFWKTDPINHTNAVAFAAYLTMVRRPTDDLGLTWGNTWQYYFDRIMTAMDSWVHDGSYPPHAITIAIVYDCLYNDMSAGQRATVSAWVEAGWDQQWGMGPGGVEVYDNGNSDDHFAKALSGIASEGFTETGRQQEIYNNVMIVVDTNEWMGFGFGYGREWHEGYPSRYGLPILLYALQYAYGYTDAQTIDRFLTHIRDAWVLTKQSILPHPAGNEVDEKFHTQDALTQAHFKTNVAASMLWALAILPGKVSLDGTGMTASDAPLADSEADYFGHWKTEFDAYLYGDSNQGRPRDILNFRTIGNGSGNVAGFWAFPAWLTYNAQEYTAVTAANAGIPLVRRWWPGTLDWTTIKSSFSKTLATSIYYRHRKWFMSNYEAGTHQNGSWIVNRNGPLLVQRGETGHGALTKKGTWGANGCVTFVDFNLLSEFQFPHLDNEDGGGQREAVGSPSDMAEVLADADMMNYGDVESWFANSQVVAISSDLTRSYNSTLIRSGSNVALNAVKLSQFEREFVCVRRDVDGTDIEKVFTYDRITLADPLNSTPTRWTPQYNLCPATEPDIDGVETEHTPYSPDLNDDLGAGGEFFTATGPTRWDYAGATRLIYDNVAEPVITVPTSAPGNGKVCVTWLMAGSDGATPVVRKIGGTNALTGDLDESPAADGNPGFSPVNGWQSNERWADVKLTSQRAYAGLYTVSVQPQTVTQATKFLVACEVMDADDTPATAATLTTDANSVGARCGPSAVVFKKETGTHTSGTVTIPSGVVLVTFTNFPAGQQRTLSAGAGLTITTSTTPTASAGSGNSMGRVVVGVSGAGVLTFS